ncbi:MAG: hypothetical protein IT322_16100 [Anaerolineae bacterium]|nr:hypothetical protein [Anaerolineae bacterium]
MASEWREYRLGDHALKIGSGATPRGGQEFYLDSGIALIRSQNIYNNHFARGGLAFVDEEEAEKLSNVRLMRNRFAEKGSLNQD